MLLRSLPVRHGPFSNVHGAVAPPPAHGRYSFTELEELWIIAGGPRGAAPTAAAVALAESGGDPNAENHNANGTVDRGLWQINSVHGSLSTKSVADNTIGAVRIYNEAHGSFSPWTTYQTGAYRRYTAPKGAPSLLSILNPLDWSTVPQGAAEIAAKLGQTGSFVASSRQQEQAGEAAGQAINRSLFGGGVAGWVGKIVVNGVLLAAGAVLVIYGIMLAVRPREGGGLRGALA